MKPSVVAHPELADQGEQKIEWVRRHMPVLGQIEAEFSAAQPLAGKRIVVCVHLEAKTANLALVLQAGGAQVSVTGSNPDSTKDDVVAALAARNVNVYARHGASPEEMLENMNSALDIAPHGVVDDGGDILELLHQRRPELLSQLVGVCEETTTGVDRARQRHAEGELGTAVMLINDARCKFLFDNVHGTGQSVWDAVMRSTNLSVAGKTVCVMGFGWCGRGIALRAAGLGARVLVCDTDPVKAADALMTGYTPGTAPDLLPQADIVITATGVANTLSGSHLPLLKSGAILANAGHFWDEIDVDQLAGHAQQRKVMRDQVEGFKLEQGWVYLLGGGHIVNIACADGHPAEIMDTSFALQALGVHQFLTGPTPEPGLYPVPDAVDQRVAELKLAAAGINLSESA